MYCVGEDTMSNALKDYLQDLEADRLRAQTAAYCCAECGERWGEWLSRIATWHNGKCEVCLAEAGVCHVRHYGWLGGSKG